jgi:hypothetical protein
MFACLEKILQCRLRKKSKKSEKIVEDALTS